MQLVSLAGLSAVFVMLWSSGWVVSRFAINDLSAMTMLTARYAIVFIAAFVLVSTLGNWRRLSPGIIACHLLIGILSHATYLLAAIGAFELGVSAALVAFVTALQPMVTAVLSGPMTQESISQRQWQGLLIGLSAVLLLLSDGYRNGLSMHALCLPFVSVLALSLGSLLNRRLELSSARKGSEPLPITLLLLIHSIGAMSILIPVSTSHGLVQLTFSPVQWVVLLWLALVVSLGAYAVMQFLLRHLSSMQVSSLTYLVPPATIVQAYLVFGDKIAPIDMAGLLIAALSVYLVMKPAKPAPSGFNTIKSYRHVDIEL